MKENKELLRSPLNIQLFAERGEYGNIDLTQGEQAKYVNSILRKLGNDNRFPLTEYFAKSASTKEAYSLFYVSGSIEARDVTSNYDTTDHNYKTIKGTNTEGFLKSIRVMPKPMECPVYVGRRAFNKSQLGEESAIQDAQVAAIYRKCDRRISELLKACITTKKRTVKDNDNNDVELAIPDTNFFGDKTKLFNDANNIKRFKHMMRKAKRLAKQQNLKIGIVMGDEGHTELIDCDKFTNKDWVNIGGETPQQTGEPIQKLLGGKPEELWTYDEVMYPNGNEEIGYIVVIVQNVLGQDNKKTNVNPEVNYIADKKAYLMDVEVDNATELLDPEGFLVFQYKRDLGSLSTPSGASVASFSMKNVQAPVAEDKDTAVPVEEEKAVIEEIETPKPKKK